MKVVSVCLLAACALFGLTSAESDLKQPITVDAAGCSAVEFNVGTKYSYTASLPSFKLPTGCNASDVKVSKLYVQDACIEERDNNLGFSSVKGVTCTKVTDNSLAVCRNVFNNGPADAIIGATTVSANQSFDSGDICSGSATAFVFLQNTCSLPVSTTIELKTSSYSGLPCATIGGRSISTVGIIIIIIASVVGLIVFSWILCCCCCGWGKCW